MKSLIEQNFSILGVEEMFNVRGGDGEETTTTTTTKHNNTAEGEDEDIIL